MVSGQSQVSDGAITGFKINNDLTTAPPSCEVPMTFELLSIAP
jgi:hypothetical protein